MGSKAGQVQETEAQKAQATHAAQLLQDYKARWMPVQAALASTIEQEGQPNSAARKLAEGKSSTDVATQFDKAGTGLDAALSNSGVGPGSSRANLAITGLGSDQAASTGLGKMMSDQAIDDAYTQGLGALTALGRGESASVGSNLSSQAVASSAQAQADAESSLMNREGDAALGGQVAGFGIQQGLFGNTPTVKPISSGFGSQPKPSGGLFAGLG
jgi:hypothetical protein